MHLRFSPINPSSHEVLSRTGLVIPKIAFSVGETGVSRSENCIFHMMRLILIYWCSLCVKQLIKSFSPIYSVVFCLESDILQPFSTRINHDHNAL